MSAQTLHEGNQSSTSLGTSGLYRLNDIVYRNGKRPGGQKNRNERFSFRIIVQSV